MLIWGHNHCRCPIKKSFLSGYLFQLISPPPQAPRSSLNCFLGPKKTAAQTKDKHIGNIEANTCWMHIPISTKLDFSIGEMSQNKQTKTLGKSHKYRDCSMPKILFYSSDRCKCWSKSPFLRCACVNFWIVYFQESLAQSEGLHSRKPAATSAQDTYCPTGCTGELQAGRESILQRQPAPADKSYQTAESSLKNAVWKSSLAY